MCDMYGSRLSFSKLTHIVRLGEVVMVQRFVMCCVSGGGTVSPLRLTWLVLVDIWHLLIF